MVPRSDRHARKTARDVAVCKQNGYPRMSPGTRRLYGKMMTPFMNVQHESDKGFYTSDKCVGCGLCSKLCPCKNIPMTDKRPVRNHNCIGCNACVVYRQQKAILFNTPEAYRNPDNAISRRLGQPDNRSRYHNSHITAKDIISAGETVTSEPPDSANPS